ncbi:MAG TPA: restriction endonuclease subunit S, partial [Pirellulaceae bacterium]|nr:restriction endonuclease subunit S [Pirellulaceae bacterium]
GPTNGRRQIASSEWIVFRSKRIHAKFLRQLLVGDVFHAMFMNTVAGVGGSLLRARPAHVAKIKIPLPPLSEQQRIAEILDRAESLRRQRRGALALLDELTQSIFLDMFGNPIANDRNWPIGKLQDVCRVDRGKFTPRPRNDPSYYGGKFPFIQTGDISSCGGRLRAWTQTLNEKGVSVSRKFSPGTVVIAIVGATLGITAILETEVYCPDSVVGIVPNENKSTSEYIDRILRWWRPIFVSQAPETARANINLETLRPLCIPLAPFSIQQKYSKLVAEIEILKAKQIRWLHQLDALFASLQHRAFRGEL